MRKTPGFSLGQKDQFVNDCGEKEQTQLHVRYRSDINWIECFPYFHPKMGVWEEKKKIKGAKQT